VGILAAHLLLYTAWKGPSSKLGQVAQELVQLNFEISKDGDSTAALGNLFQCLTALLVQLLLTYLKAHFMQLLTITSLPFCCSLLRRFWLCVLCNDLLSSCKWQLHSCRSLRLNKHGCLSLSWCIFFFSPLNGFLYDLLQFGKVFQLGSPKLGTICQTWSE